MQLTLLIDASMFTFIGCFSYGTTYFLYSLLHYFRDFSNKQKWCISVTGSLLTVLPFMIILLFPEEHVNIEIYFGSRWLYLYDQLLQFSSALAYPVNFIPFMVTSSIAGKVCIDSLSNNRFLLLKHSFYFTSSILIFIFFLLLLSIHIYG
ncbi:MAG: hypothetical protein Q8P72_01215 [Candidatus Roizmanbacteria bacterium]|nr:hypothetical protein [Candidatus Roizmanbacteria bacterium]